jgi:hypothetical protein
MPSVLANESSLKPSNISHNSFSVPDYDDYDSEKSDDSVMEVKYIPSPPRVAAIPESIISVDASFGSDDEEAPYEPWKRSYCNTFESKDVARNIEDAHDAIQEAIGSTSKSKTSPADVITWYRCGSNMLNTSIANESSVKLTPAESSPPSTSQQAKVQTTINLQAKTLPTPFMAVASSNLTDEQSESDYGDDISADLFDEDFELNEYPRSKPPLDTSSFSSQSPILTSLPSKIELAARQPIVKISNKPTLPHLPFLGSAPAEQRAPSPSDAAMPKKPVYHSPENKSPPKATTKAHSSLYVYGFDSVPTDSRDTSYMRSYGYTPSQDTSNVQDTYPQPYFPVEAGGYGHPYYAPPAMDWSWGANQPVKKTAAPAAKTGEPEAFGVPIPAPASPFVTIKTTPRVAIKDLVEEAEKVDDVAQEPRGTAFAKFIALPRKVDNSDSTSSGLKRKADQISEAEDLSSISASLAAVEDAMEVSGSQDHENAQVISKLVADSQSQADLWGPVGMIDTPGSAPKADIHDQIVEERPKKKARSDLYKYAAGAAGGIAIGAVGIVAALVALPPDFFV